LSAAMVSYAAFSLEYLHIQRTIPRSINTGKIFLYS
jgi:hypothetical protein